MKISVIITSLNYGHYIENAIKSVLNQDYPSELYEIIVVDAGSIDNTPQILEKYNNLIKVVHQTEKTGLAGGCNLGIKASKGDYILRLDADDMFCQNILKIESSYLDENKDIGFVYPDYIVKKGCSKKRFILPDFDEDEIRQRGDFLGGGTMYRKSLFERYGYYDENFRSIENYDLILNLLDHGIKGYHIDLPLFIYNHHGDSMSDDLELMERAWKMVEKKHGGKYGFGKYHPRNVDF